MMVHERWERGGGTGVIYVVEHSTGTLCTRHVFPTGVGASIHTEKKPLPMVQWRGHKSTSLVQWDTNLFLDMVSFNTLKSVD